LHGTTGISWTNTVGTYLFYQSALNVTRDGAESMNLNRLTSDGDILTFRKAGTTVGSIGTNGGNLTVDAGGDIILDADGGDIFFKDGGTEFLSFTGGGINRTGNLTYNVSGIQVFNTNSTEAMRIDSSGNVLVGGTTYGDSDCFSVSSGGNIVVARASGNGRTMVSFKNGGADVGLISTTNTATTYGTSSDGRLKDITGSARGLEVINELNPVAYNWKADGKADEGLIAQEVLDIVPNAVSGSEEEMYQMDYSKLVVHLVAGMKEQQTQIDALQSEINLLKGE